VLAELLCRRPIRGERLAELVLVADHGGGDLGGGAVVAVVRTWGGAELVLAVVAVVAALVVVVVREAAVPSSPRWRRGGRIACGDRRLAVAADLKARPRYWSPIAAVAFAVVAVVPRRYASASAWRGQRCAPGLFVEQPVRCCGRGLARFRGILARAHVDDGRGRGVAGLPRAIPRNRRS
jgi:hypothetical protein